VKSEACIILLTPELPAPEEVNQWWMKTEYPQLLIIEPTSKLHYTQSHQMKREHVFNEERVCMLIANLMQLYL